MEVPERVARELLGLTARIVGALPGTRLGCAAEEYVGSAAAEQCSRVDPDAVDGVEVEDPVGRGEDDAAGGKNISDRISKVVSSKQPLTIIRRAAMFL
jgi:hypothetical protein